MTAMELSPHDLVLKHTGTHGGKPSYDIMQELLSSGQQHGEDPRFKRIGSIILDTERIKLETEHIERG